NEPMPCTVPEPATVPPLNELTIALLVRVPKTVTLPVEPRLALPVNVSKPESCRPVVGFNGPVPLIGPEITTLPAPLTVTWVVMLIAPVSVSVLPAVFEVRVAPKEPGLKLTGAARTLLPSWLISFAPATLITFGDA